MGILGSLLLYYVALSDRPWWILRGGSTGERLFEIAVSPFAFSAELLGKPIIVPIIPYLNLAARLSVLLAASTTLIGSIFAGKKWSGPLLSLRGLTVPLVFLLGIIAGT
ncbi:MAG: hypothetical protein QXO17_02515 [Nitrososphaerota archaeon]